MKVTIDTKIGLLTYDESFFSGKKVISIEGKEARKISKTKYVITKTIQNETGDYVDKEIEIYLSGSVMSGVKIYIDDDSYQVLPKPIWFEIVIPILFAVITIIWGNVSSLVKILPLVGGAVGGLVTGLVNVIGFSLSRLNDKKPLKLLYLIGFGILAFLACLLIGFIIVQASK